MYTRAIWAVTIRDMYIIPSSRYRPNCSELIILFSICNIYSYLWRIVSPIGTSKFTGPLFMSLGLWVIAVDPAFIASHQSIKNYGIWIDQLDHLPAVMTTSFFLIFSKHPWDKLRGNLPHLQFLANNCVYCSHTDIKLCTYCLYRHTTVLIHEILYLAYQLWCIDFLTPPTPLIIPHRLPAFL